MEKTTRYSPEVRERAVRLVFEHEGEYASQWSAIQSIAGKIGCTAETLLKWVRRAETDAGRREGLTTEDRERIKALERENSTGLRSRPLAHAAIEIEIGSAEPSPCSIRSANTRRASTWAFASASSRVAPYANTPASSGTSASHRPSSSRSLSMVSLTASPSQPRWPRFILPSFQGSVRFDYLPFVATISFCHSSRRRGSAAPFCCHV